VKRTVLMTVIAFLPEGNHLMAQETGPCNPEKTYTIFREALENKACVRYFSYRVAHKELLSPKIAELERLALLDLKSNSLKYLPDEIGRLDRLKHLTLSSNHIRRLPRTIGNCRSLEMLQADNNALVELPPQAGQLTALVFMDLSWNHIAALPP